MLRFLLGFEQEGKFMNRLMIAASALALLIFCTSGADAQAKKPRKPVSKKPVASSTIPPLDVRTAREKVSIQLANVNRFVDVLGPIAQGIETLDESGRTRPLPQRTADRNEENKQKVVEAIRNLKAGLADLEAEFRAKPLLQKYLANIDGITDMGAESEDSALAGKFVAAKDPLRNITRRLSDTLAALPR